MNDTFLRQSLNCIVQNEQGSIKAYVAREVLERNNVKAFFTTLSQRGCISGMISELNHYKQTHEFFDQYYEEIEQLRIDTGKAIRIEYDLKTSLAWFAFEQTALNIANELGISTDF